jgi:hypothetical protein
MRSRKYIFLIGRRKNVLGKLFEGSKLIPAHYSPTTSNLGSRWWKSAPGASHPISHISGFLGKHNAFKICSTITLIPINHQWIFGGCSLMITISFHN